MVGVVVGWALLWWHGRAFVFEGPAAVEGYGWPGYLNNAWMVANRQDVGYDLFRLPLHGAVVGGLGELLGSTVSAAVAVASLGMGLAVVAAALLGATLSGPWAGGAAAVLLVLVSHNTDAARWANSYPLQAGLGGAALALGALSARHPRLGSAVAGGVLGCLAAAVDGRAGLLALGAACLSVLALVEAPRWRTALVPAAFALGLALSPGVTAALDVTGGALPPLHEKVEFQRGVALRWASMARDRSGQPDRALQAACAGQPSLERPSLEALQRPCAREMARYNLQSVLPRHAPAGVVVTLVLGLGLLLPGRQGWRGSLRGLGVLAVALVPLALELRWVPLPDRYVVPRAVLLAVLAPAGAARAAATLPGRFRLGMGAAACLGLVAWGVWGDPSGRHAPTALQQSTHLAEQRAAIAAVQASWDGGPLLDCSAQYVQTALLPAVLGPRPPLLRLEEGSRCLDWVAQAPVGGWLLADRKHDLRVHAPGSRPRTLRLDAALLESAGWEIVVEQPHFQAWRRTR